MHAVLFLLWRLGARRCPCSASSKSCNLCHKSCASVIHTPLPKQRVSQSKSIFAEVSGCTISIMGHFRPKSVFPCLKRVKRLHSCPDEILTDMFWLLFLATNAFFLLLPLLYTCTAVQLLRSCCQRTLRDLIQDLGLPCQLRAGCLRFE